LQQANGLRNLFLQAIGIGFRTSCATAKRVRFEAKAYQDDMLYDVLIKINYSSHLLTYKDCKLDLY